jgi:hypothetical protein
VSGQSAIFNNFNKRLSKPELTNSFMIKSDALYVFIITCCSLQVAAQELTADQSASIKAEIESLLNQEQEAFIKGECNKVVVLYATEVTFFANGRRAPSRDFIERFCNQIPRPFQRTGEIKDAVIVLSSTAAYAIREITFPPVNADQKEFKKEVVTKLFTKSKEGWKITHFHSSVHTMQ